MSNNQINEAVRTSPDPTDWKTVKLGEVCEIERNGIEASKIETGTVYVGLENIERNGEFTNVGQVEAGDLASTKFHFGPQHLLYGKLRPYLSKIAKPDFEGVCSTDILPLLAGEKLERGFLYHFLRLPDMIELAKNRSTGANLPRLSPKALAEFELPLPPLAEQQRIAAILDRADALRGHRRASLEQLDELAQSLFLEQFGDPATNPKFPMVTVEKALERIIDYRGKSPEKTTTGIPLVTARIIKSGRVLPANEFIAEDAYDSWMRRGLPESGDVVFTTEAPMGECALLNGEKIALAQRVLLLRPKKEMMTGEFLRDVLSSKFVRRDLMRRSTGSTVLGIRQSEFRQVQIPLPSLSLQQEFARQIGELEAIKTRARASLVELDALFGALQERAFAGELSGAK